MGEILFNKKGNPDRVTPNAATDRQGHKKHGVTNIGSSLSLRVGDGRRHGCAPVACKKEDKLRLKTSPRRYILDKRPTNEKDQ